MVMLGTACSKPYELKGSEFPDNIPAPEIVGLSDDTPFQLSEHEGKVVVIFFGFTYCPDICPLTMAEIRQAYDQINNAQDDTGSDDMVVIFVTVDPERDTPDAVATYASAFHGDFIGVYVPLEEQEALRKSYFLFVEKEYTNGETAGDDYLVAHTDNIYLVDRAGNLRAFFRGSDFALEDLVADLQHLVSN